MNKLRTAWWTGLGARFTILALLGPMVWPLAPMAAATEGQAVAVLVEEKEPGPEQEAARHLLSGAALALAETEDLKPLAASMVAAAVEDLKLASPYRPADLARLGQKVAAVWVVAGEVNRVAVDEKGHQATVEVALRLVDVARGEVVSRSQVRVRSTKRPRYRGPSQEWVQEAADQAATVAVQELLAYRDRPTGYVLSAATDRLTVSLGTRQGVHKGAELSILRDGQAIATARVTEASATNATAVLLDTTPGANVKLQDQVRVVYTPSPTLQETASKKAQKAKRSQSWVWIALLVLGGIALANKGGGKGTARAPATPRGFTVVAGNGEARLYWEENTETNLAGYRVYRSELPDRGFTLIVSPPATATSHTDTNLRNGQIYYYRLSAVDTRQRESTRTAVVGVTPGIVTAPATPTGLMVTPGDEQVTLAWQPNAEGNLAGYGVYRSPEADRGFLQIAVVTVPDTSYVDTEVTNGTTYYYRLTALAADQSESQPTAAVRATPVSATAPSVPKGLAATPGDGQVLVQWNANPEPDVAFYRLYRALAQNGNYVRLDPPVQHPTTSYADTDVTNGTTYYYRLTAVNLAGLESNRTEFVSATPQAAVAPATPTGLIVTAGDQQVTLTWQPNAEGNLVGYGVYRSPEEDRGFRQIATVTVLDTSYIDTDVTNGTTYFYRLTALATDQAESPPTATVRATPVSAVAPAVPTGLKATSGDGQVFLQWNANPEPDVASYRLYRALAQNGNYVRLDPPIQHPATSYADTDVTNGVTYYYRLTAVNLAGLESNRTEFAAATPQATVAPATPTGLIVTAGDQQVTLTWQPNAEGNLIGYGVYRSPRADQGFRRIATVPVPDTSYVDTDVINGTTYYYRLTALAADQSESLPTAAVRATPVSATAPSVPTGLTATPGDRQVLVQWNTNPEPDVASYRLYRALAQNGNYVRLDPPIQHPTTSYTDTDVTNGVTYYYRLTAVNLAGLESNRTEFASATPQATVAPTTPTGFTAAPGDKQVVLTWNANPEGDLADYRLFRSDAAGGEFTVVATITAPVTTFTDTNLINGQPYFYRLTARNLNGLESAPTQPLSVTPVSSTPPSFPKGLDVQAQFDRLILVWMANPEPDLKEYRLYRAVDNVNVPTFEDGATPYAVVPRQTTTYIDHEVTADHIYYYRLTAVNLADLESAPSTPAQGRPGQPKVQLLAPADGQHFVPERQIDLEKNQETRSVTIQFGWHPVANASRYLFELAEDESITRLLANELILASGTPTHEVTLTKGPFTPIGAIIGTEDLYWRITAVNDNNVVIDQSQVWGVTIDWDG